MSVTLSSDTLSTLFSSMSTSTSKSSSTTGLESLLGDYNANKNGTYYKLLKAYYAKEGSTSSTSTSTSTDSDSTVSQIQSAASDLNDSVSALTNTGTKSVFSKTTSTDANGTTSTSYDTDAIYNAVSKYVDNYNSMIKAANSSSDSKVTSTAASMINSTKAESSLLSSLGITIDSSNYTLSIDEDTFKSADMSTAKTLFNGSGSYAYQVSANASMMNWKLKVVSLDSLYTFAVKLSKRTDSIDK